jgi:hypothetical protein
MVRVSSSRPLALALLQASNASEFLWETICVQWTVTQIKSNRRSDVLLGFDSAQKVSIAVIPISAGLAVESEWISSLKDATVILSGVIGLYAEKQAMRILEQK